jgi:hypothetical protein
MTRPIKLPQWADAPSVPTDIVEPSDIKKGLGWTTAGTIPEKPPYQYFNYWQNLVFNWVSYFDALISEQGFITSNDSVVSITIPTGKTLTHFNLTLLHTYTVEGNLVTKNLDTTNGILISTTGFVDVI